MLTRLRALVLIALSSAVACSLTSLDGFSTPVSPDAAQPDALIAQDAGNERAAPDTRRFCETNSTATFCADFDQTSLPAPFEIVNGTATIDKSDSVSPPSSFKTSIPGDNTKGTKAFASWTAPKSGTKIVLGFSVKIPELGQGNQYDLAALAFSESGGVVSEVEVQILETGKLQFWERRPNGNGGPTYSVTPLDALPLGRWVRVDWTLTITDQGGAMSVAVDGKDLGNANTITGKYNAPPKLVIGDAYQENLTKGWTVSYDDVLLVVE